MNLSSISFGTGVSRKDVLFFTSQLAVMLDTGTSLTASLQAIADQCQNPRMRAVVESILADVVGGRMLSSALGRHPRVFSSVFVSMVRAGELGGFLNQMLNRLHEFQKLKEETRSKIVTAMAYPAVLTVMSIGVVLFMIMYVLPRLTKVFEGKEDILPVITKVVLATSDVFVAWWPLIFGGLVAAIGGAVAWAHTPTGRRFFDRAKISLPLVGSVARLLYASRLLRTLGVMLESGIPLLDGLEVTRGTVGNSQYVDFLDDAHEKVRQGKTLSDPFSRCPLFTPAVRQMVSTGEATGTTGMVMLRMADYYEDEMTARLKGLTALLEPAIVVAMGGVVGFIALALFLPLFRLSRAVG
ncbi:MAG: type II secretion system F family protein [Planctomycetota bacterium]